jgi:hypothetical protein
MTPCIAASYFATVLMAQKRDRGALYQSTLHAISNDIHVAGGNMLFEPCLNLANWEDVLEAVRSDQRFLGRL